MNNFSNQLKHRLNRAHNQAGRDLVQRAWDLGVTFSVSWTREVETVERLGYALDAFEADGPEGLRKFVAPWGWDIRAYKRSPKKAAYEGQIGVDLFRRVPGPAGDGQTIARALLHAAGGLTADEEWLRSPEAREFFACLKRQLAREEHERVIGRKLDKLERRVFYMRLREEEERGHDQSL